MKMGGVSSQAVAVEVAGADVTIAVEGTGDGGGLMAAINRWQ